MARIEDEVLPFVDKRVVKYLKDVYDNRFLLEIVKNEKMNADTALGFMQGVQAVVDRLDALSTRDDPV